MASVFLPHSLKAYALKGQLHRLLGRKESDTGLIENDIVTYLPESKRQGFRVAKFLLQNYVDHHFGTDTSLNQSMRGLMLHPSTHVKLYGFKKFVSSYTLRVLLFHLMQHIRANEAETLLNGGVLAVCLLDMLRECSIAENDLYLFHPFIKDKLDGLVPGGIHMDIDKLIASFMTQSPDEFDLMDNENILPFTPNIML